MSTEAASACALAASVGAAAALVSGPYRFLRHGVTAVHEAGHAAVALVCGRRLQAIRLNTDSSGETVSVGPSRGFGVVLTLLAGYPAPALAGLSGVWCALAGLCHVWALSLLVLLGSMLVLLRNLFGALVLLCLVAVLLAVVRYLGQDSAVPAVVGLSVFLLLAAVRGVHELATYRGPASDARSLALATPFPAAVWVLLFLVIAVACAAVGFLMLWDGLTPFLDTSPTA